MTTVPNLAVKATDKTGKTYYEPVIWQVKWQSKHNDNEWQFAGRPTNEYWTFSPQYTKFREHEELIKGMFYKLSLASKPKPNADTTYKDIVEFREATMEVVEGSAYAVLEEPTPPEGGWPSLDEPTTNPFEDENMLDRLAISELERERFTGKPEPGHESAERPKAGIKVEGVVQGHLEKLAVDLYRLEREFAGIHKPIDVPNYLRIREIRDSLYHQVKEKLIQPQHWCYTHETARKASPAGTYAHPHPDGGQQVFCTEAGLVDSQGQPIDYATNDLPF